MYSQGPATKNNNSNAVLGNLDMRDLLTSPIKHFALGIYDGPHATPRESNEGPIFLGIKNVTPEGRLDLSDIRHVSEQEYPKWTRRVTPQKDDVVFSYEATLHRYALIPEGFRGCLGRRMALVRPDKKKIIPRFLHYYFLSPAWREIVEANIINGATVDRIPIRRFPDFEVSIPSLAMQQSVVDTLSAYDDMIENNRRRIQLLEESARLLYKEWFVRFRFPGHEHVKIVDGVPEGWERKQLGEIATIVMGQSPKSKYYNNIGNGLPFHQGVTNFGVRFPSHETYCSLPSRLAEAGDILFSVRAPVGRINITSDKIVIGRGLAAIRSNREQQNFLFYALKDHFFKEDMIGGGAIFAAITKKDLHDVRILTVPDSTAKIFMEHVQPIDHQISNLHKTVEKLSKARDLLLPRLMNGEIAV
ncbi:MAG: restriction endonuclease subunit S [Verrucomicrobiae bacterium]|nr:restriction endonuclease subunit S [Verrucomicrobiae bacterium]